MNYFDKLNLLKVFGDYFGFTPYEVRGQVVRFNSKLSIYIYNEDNAKHNRPHAHVEINNQKVAVIWLDSFELDDGLEKKDKKVVNEYLKNHKQNFIDEWNKCNNRITIEYMSIY